MVDPVVRTTRKWLDSVVIGLELCPFAAPVVAEGRLRIAKSAARDPRGLVSDLDYELALLSKTPVEELETTLLVHPHVLHDFEDYNDFLDVADALLIERGCEGVLQIASFHPRYRFASPTGDAGADEDAANWTNRSPFPMLHLLREASVEAAIAAFGDTASIPERNAARLRAMGTTQARALLADCFEYEDAEGSERRAAPKRPAPGKPKRAN